MKSNGFAKRRRVMALMVVVALAASGILGATTIRAGIFPTANMPNWHGYVHGIGGRAKHMKDYLVAKFESYFEKEKATEGEESELDEQKIVVTRPTVKEVTITKQFVCQIHSRRHIEVRALESGYLEAIQIVEGQQVKEGQDLFKVIPVIYQANADAADAEARVAQLELDYTKKLYNEKVVSVNDVNLHAAKAAQAKAKADLARAQLDFASVKARFDGIIDRLYRQQGSLVQENEILTTLSDNAVMWVYFNVPEKQYLEYVAMSKQEQQAQKIELVLANQEKFPQRCESLRVEGQFNNETGNIAFRADLRTRGRCSVTVRPARS
jgi:membrane fusion protein (multidrug efflux system)